MNKLVRIVESQPARAYIYPGVLGIVAYLVGKGVIDSDTASWITGIVAAVVGIGATETVHAKVIPSYVVRTALRPAPAATPPSPPGAADDRQA